MAVAPLTVLRSWDFQVPVLVGLFLTGALYAAGLRSMPGGWKTSRPWRHRTGAFFAGLAMLGIALLSPVSTYSSRLLSVHMVQHLLLAMVVPPLLLMGAPVTLILRASSEGTRKRLLVPLLRSPVVRILSNPIIGWALFAGVIWGTHFGPFYDATLQNESVHALEHLAYLVAGLLFWRPVVGADPAPSSGLSHPARLLYLFLAMPQMAFLGLAIYGSDRVLYTPYLATSAALHVSALADQHLAGAIMWESGILIMAPAMAVVLFDWMRRDERQAERTDERLARGPAWPAPAQPRPRAPGDLGVSSTE